MTNTVSFISYNNITGEILSTGRCPFEIINLQGANVIEGTADDSKQYIDINTLEIINKPNKPDGEYIFDYNIKNWIPDTAQQWNEVRYKRNQLLQESDWTQLPDVPLSTKEVWAAYRQQLRDITNQADPFNIVWPIAPT